MSKVQEALIEAHLKTLKMPGIRGEYSQLARQARADSWSYEDYLRELLNPTRVPDFEAVATTGMGVFDTLKAVAKQVLIELKRGR